MTSPLTIALDSFLSTYYIPLMYVYELLDVIFFVKCFKSPDPSFPIWDHVSFSTASTRSASAAKLNHKSRSSTLSRAYLLLQIGPHLEHSPSYRPLSFPLYNEITAKKDFLVSLSFHVLCPCCRCSQLPVKVCFTHTIT